MVGVPGKSKGCSTCRRRKKGVSPAASTGKYLPPTATRLLPFDPLGPCLLTRSVSSSVIKNVRFAVSVPRADTSAEVTTETERSSSTQPARTSRLPYLYPTRNHVRLPFRVPSTEEPSSHNVRACFGTYTCPMEKQHVGTISLSDAVIP